MNILATAIGPLNLPAQQWFCMFLAACFAALFCGLCALGWWFRCREEGRVIDAVISENIGLRAKIKHASELRDNANARAKRLEGELEELKDSEASLIDTNRRLAANRPQRNKLVQYAKRETDA